MKKTVLISGFMVVAVSAFAQTSQYQVLVQNRSNHSVQLYSESGTYLYDIISSGSGGLSAPEDILFLPDSTMLVSGINNTALKRYDALTGTYLGNFTTGYSLSLPSKMSIGPDSLIYVTQWGTTQNKVVRFTLTGQFVDEFTSVGTPNGLEHVWDAEGNFYISVYGNGGNGFIQKFDSLGNDLGVFIANIPLQGPTDIWWAANGDMLVADWTSGKVWRYDSNGTYLGWFISVGLVNPEGVAFTPDGKLLIGDWGLDQVLQYDTLGNYQGAFAFGNGLDDPNGVHIHPINLLATSVNELSQQAFQIFPNPANDVIHIQFADGTLQKNIRYEISDLRGSILQSGNINTTDFSVNISTLPSGAYLINISGTEVHSVKKFIKN